MICPNIRPQSGPEGGGDGKTEADTFQFGDAISDLTYIGHPGPGQSDWCFAFSAMKDWKRKVPKLIDRALLADAHNDVLPPPPVGWTP